MCKSVETFTSKRLNGFASDKAKVNCGGDIYWLAEKKQSDGYLYEIPATELRIYPKKEYPDRLFTYTRYHIESVRKLSHLDLDRLKTEDVVRFNGGYGHSVYVVSRIVDEVWRYVLEK